jgi:hypothetical protein
MQPVFQLASLYLPLSMQMLLARIETPPFFSMWRRPV